MALAEPEDVRLYLVAAAKAGSALSYGELLERLGYNFSRPKMRALCAILGKVDEDAQARGEPELAVLVVRQSDGLPGQGWWIGRSAATANGLDHYDGPWEGPEARRFVERVQGETFAWWQSRSGTGDETARD
jgi:hypothetical protein